MTQADAPPLASRFATADLPGTGGLLRATEDDFRVEEIPAYLPSGAGEHLYLWVEKRGLTTPEAARRLARRAGLRERDVGYAGLKDKRGVTRQWLSLAGRDPGLFAGWVEEGLRVLEVRRHGNKLRTGHARGNRFAIAVRSAGPDAAARARAILAALEKTGVPNAYGPQRFGRSGETASLGRALLLGGAHPQLERARRDRFLKRLALSALQSQLFNAALRLRMQGGSWTRALEGDVLQKPSGACFLCEDPAAEQPRVDRFEVAPAGPMFGPKLLASRGKAREVEEQVLSDSGLAERDFAAGGDLTQGARRALRVPLLGARSEERDGALWIIFELPRGSYASVVMAEVTKGEVALAEEG